MGLLVGHADRLASAQLRHEDRFHRHARVVEVRRAADLLGGFRELGRGVEKKVEILQRRALRAQRVGDARRHGAARISHVHVHDVDVAPPAGQLGVDIQREHEIGQALVDLQVAARERADRIQYPGDRDLALPPLVIVEVELPGQPVLELLDAEHGAKGADCFPDRIDDVEGPRIDPRVVEGLEQQVDRAELVLGRHCGAVFPQAVVERRVPARRVLVALRRLHRPRPPTGSPRGNEAGPSPRSTD